MSISACDPTSKPENWKGLARLVKITVSAINQSREYHTAIPFHIPTRAEEICFHETVFLKIKVP